MKRVLFIGAAKGEPSLARAIAASGQRVLVAEPGRSRSDGQTLGLDLNDRNATFTQIGEGISALGGLDVMVFAAAHDAASFIERAHRKGETEPQAWRRMVGALLNGGFFCAQAALRHMVDQGQGSIVFLCADSAVDGGIRIPSISAATCGLLAFSASVAAPAFRHGVTVNALILGAPFVGKEELPPIADTPTEEVLPYASKAAFAAMRERTLHRLSKRSGVGWAESVAAIVNYLASDEGGMISGATLRLANVGEAPFLSRWSY